MAIEDVFVEVMYADQDADSEWRWDPDGTPSLGHLTRVNLDDRATLAITGVLAVVLSAVTTEEKSRRVIDGVHYRRVGELWGSDNYNLTLEDDGKFWLHGWDDNFHRYRNVSAPFDVTRVAAPPLFPLAKSIVFTGVQIPGEEWTVAFIKADRDMH